MKKIHREIKHEAIFKHLVEAQMPFSFPQLKRLDRSLQDKRLFTKSKYDAYGQTYEFGDEVCRTLWIQSGGKLTQVEL